MKCYVYRSTKQKDCYLYLPVQDDFSVLPEALAQQFGRPEFALSFELNQQRQLAQADSKKVLQSIDEQGFYLQLAATNAVMMERLLKKISQLN